MKKVFRNKPAKADGTAPERKPPGTEVTGRVQTLEEENRQLKRAVEELSILNDLSRAIGASVDSQDIIRKIIDRSMRAVQAEQTVITLVDRDASQPMKTLVRAMTSSAEHPHYHVNENLLGWMHLYKKPLLTNEPAADERFKGLKWDLTINSILCVPLMVKSELRGVITSYNKKEANGFTHEDQRLLAIIASQSAQIIENARLYEEEKAYISIKEQIRLAYQIQKDLLPKSPPNIPGYDIAARSIPAQMVGGDYYDFIRVRDGRWAICLGDVSGKGLPASLLMANLQATLRGQTLLNSPVHECIARSNKLIYESTDPEKFATLFYGLLDPMTHDLAYCNAGHEIPFVLSGAGEPSRLETGGIALGVLDVFPYSEDAVCLGAGDLLVIYSDGIPDANNEFDQPFGESRFISLVRQFCNEPAAVIIDKIVEAVQEHESGTERLDDLTMVVVKREA